MKNVKFKTPQVIELESTNTSNIKDMLIECWNLANKYDIEIDLTVNGFLFNIEKTSNLIEKEKEYKNWLSKLDS